MAIRGWQILFATTVPTVLYRTDHCNLPVAIRQYNALF
jgi:hypothetical protein